MVEAGALPQHVFDTRYLYELGARILPRDFRRSNGEEEEEETVEKVAYDLEDAAQRRWCHCDPWKRWKKGFDEDSDEEDGWFCTYRSIEDQYQMHVVLEQARLDIGEDPTEFSKAIYEEIVERCKIEHTKLSATRAQNASPSDEQIHAAPPPSPPHPCGYPPFSFQQLPEELLVEIALLAQASDPYAHVKLSHVDASLRALVNSTPLLWSRVDFLYPLHMVHRYLERSADVLLRVTALPPLHIGFANHPVLEGVKKDESAKLKEFMRALRPHRHRIHSFRLRYEDIMFEVSGENEGPMPVHDFLWDGSMVELELLDLEFGDWTLDGTKAFPSSYSVRELHLHRSWTREYLPLFSSSLKSLVITDERAPFSKIVDALQAAPCLTSLTFRDMSFTGIGEKKGPVLDLGQLESLALVRVVGSAAEALLNCIVASNLTSIVLQLALHSVDDRTDINQLPLFPAPRPSVRHLDLTACDGGPSFFESVFRTFPHLTHLRIASSNVSAEDLLLLATKLYHKSGDGFQLGCPNLKHLTIDNELNAITEVTRVMLKLRYNLRFPLESLTLRGISVNQALLERLLALDEIIPKIEIAEFDQELDVYEDPDDGSASETSSEGDWASGDEEIVTTYRQYMLHEDTPVPDVDLHSE